MTAVPLSGLDAPSATAAIQRAIDAAHAAGGGRVEIASGTRAVVGTLVLRSRVELHLAPGSRLVASPERAHYREVAFGGAYGSSPVSGILILAEDAEDIAITGSGVIDGQALSWMTGFRDAEGRFIREHAAFRPRGVVLTHCRGVRLDGIRLEDMPFWTIHLTGCREVRIDGVSVRNRLDVPNCDGIDPDHCTDVLIQNCDIDNNDDDICLKAGRDFDVAGLRDEPRCEKRTRGHLRAKL